MDWFTRKFEKWATSKQREELTTFVAMLKAMDGDELGLLVAGATHARHVLEGLGHDVMNPIEYVVKNPGFPLTVTQTIQDYQKAGRPQEAASLMVWAHTLRGAVRLELRGLAREMWGELERGFDHVESATVVFANMGGIVFRTHGARSFPVGFTPEPK